MDKCKTLYNIKQTNFYKFKEAHYTKTYTTCICDTTAQDGDLNVL